MPADQFVNTDPDQLYEGLDLETDLRHKLVLTRRPSLSVEFQNNPDDVRSFDDVYTLFSTDEAETYNHSYTVADDTISGDNFLTLTWWDLDPSLNYTLRIDPGVGEDAFDLFADVPYDTLKQAEEEEQVLNDWGEDASGSDEVVSQVVPQEVEIKLEDDDPTDEEVDETWDELLEEEEDEGEPEPEDLR